MRKIFTFLTLALVAQWLNGQITTAVTMSGTAIAGSPFASFSAAITAVNGLTITGPVVVNVPAGGTETLSGKIVLTATGTSANTITIQKSGTGANPILTSYGGTSSTASIVADGFFVIAGGDYITIDGIDLQEAAANTTATTVMEFGYALTKASVTDGAQNNTIKNCTITLNRLQNASWTAPGHNGSCGIVVLNTLHTAASALTPTAATGSNSFNKFYSNTIQNCNAGIVFVGFAATAGVGPSPNASTFLGDMNNDIGGASASTGNTILNFGGGAATNPATGIFANNQWSLNCSYNTINNNNGSGVNHTTTLRGIFLNSSSTSANATCNNNSITIKGGATTSQVSGIECSFGATPASNTVEISNNTITGSYLTATSGVYYGIYATLCTPATLKINNNNIGNIEYSTNALTGSGVVYPIYNTNSNATTSIEMNDNNVHHINRYGTTGSTTIGIYQSSGTTGQAITIKRNTVKSLTISGTGATSTIYGIQAAIGTIVIDSNTIDSLICVKTTGTSSLYGIYDISSPTNENYNYNSISNLIHNGTGTVYGLYANSTTGTRNVIGNRIWAITGAGTTVAGLAMAASTPTIRDNKIYDIRSTSTGAPTVSGMLIISATSGTVNIYNNLIGDIKAPAASTNAVTAPAVRGINITGTSTATWSVSFNSIYLNASSTGTNFGSAGIFHTGSATATSGNLLMRNNNIVNASTPAGTGLAVAFQRSLAALNNFDVASNRNNFYAGTPGAANLIYYDGTNSDQTLSAYQARVSTREANSISENPTFVSTTPTSADFLKIDVSVPTQLESGATPISGITTDFGGNTRNASTPDIGAYEFAGTTPAPSFANMSATPALTTLCTKANRTITIDITTSAGSISSATLNYSHNGTAQTPITMTNTSGNTWSGTMTAPTVGNDVVTWSITATNSLSISSTYNGASYSDEPNTGVTATATAVATSACVGSPDTLRVSLTKPINAIVGNGSSTLVSTTGNPYRMGAGSTSHRLQYLISAAELTSAGLNAGNLTSLTMTTTTASTSGSITSYEIKMAHTAATDMTTTFLTPTFTTLFSNTTGLTLTTPGANTHAFTTPFAWNGTDNVVMEICYVTLTGTSPTVVANSATGITTPTIHATGATNCVATTGTTSTTRPQFIFAGQGAPVPTSHQWILNNTTNVSTANPYPFSVIAGSNDYKDSMTLSGCPFVSNTVTINNAIPTFSVTAVSSSLGAAFCSGNTTILSSDATGGCTPYTYSWTGPSTGTSATLNVTASGTYKVVVTDAAGAIDSADITITVHSLPTVSISPTLASVCGAKPAQLDALPLVGTSNYTWSVTGSSAVTGLYIDNTATTAYTVGGSSNPIYAKPTGSTTYTVTVTDANSCTATATRTVGVYDSISRYKLADPTILCTGGSGQLIDSPWMLFNVTHNSFAANSTTYTPITTGGGATDITSALTAGGTSFDDAVLDSVPIGFNFSFRDSVWTQVAVTTNGTVTPHTIANTLTQVTNNLSTQAGVIAPFWDDNNITGGTVLYQTTGTAPSRVFTLQYSGLHAGGGGTATNPTIDMQVKLYETTNVIEFIYGSSSAALVSTTASIGISGAVGKYLSLNNSTSSATASSTTNTTSIATAATSGQRFVFTPLTSNFTHSWTNSLGASGATFSATNIYNPTISGFANTENYIDSIYETSTGCYRTDTLTISLSSGGVTINAINSTAGSTVCVGYGSTLSPDFGGGCGPYTFNWSDDPNPGAPSLSSSQTFNVTPTATTTYYLTITDNLGISTNNVSSGGYTLNVNNPTPTGTPQSICATSGVFTLGATPATSGNLMRWYTASMGGTPISSGTSYTTPNLTTSTNYYIEETEKSGTTTGLGKLDTTGGTLANITTTNYGIVFNLTKRTIIDSVDVYMAHTTPTVLKISLKNSAGVTLQSKYFNVPAGTTVPRVKYTLPLDFIVEPGTGYRLIKDSTTGTLVRQTTGIAYPYSLGSFGSVTSSCWSCQNASPSIQTGQYIYFFNLSLSDAGCTGTRVPVSATLTTPPTITPTVSAPTICNGTSTTLDVTSSNSGYTYTWYPGALSGATQTVSPTNTTSGFAPEVTTYTVSATDGSLNCTATATVNVSVNPNPLITSTTQQSSAHCSGDINKMYITVPQPSIKDYIFSTATGSSLDPMTGATQVLSNSNDDTYTDFTPSPAFSFNYEGTTYTSFGVVPDGWLKLGTGGTSDFGNGVTDATNLPKLYPYWDDLATGADGEVRYVVNGTAPNRIMVVEWFVTIPRSTTGAANSRFQVWLYESNGKIEYRYGSMGTSTMSASVGVTANATTYQSINTALNASSTSVATNNISAQPASGSMFTYTKPTSATFNWTPITGLYTNAAATTAYAGGAGAYDTLYAKNTATQNYTVTLTNGYGCTNDTTIKDSVKTAAGNVVLAGSSVTGAAVQCMDSSGWTYYESASNPNQFIFGINKAGSTLTGETVSIEVGSTYTSNSSTNSTGKKHQCFLMGRSWEVTAASFTGPVSIRFFYSPTDTAAIVTLASDSLTASGDTSLRASNFEWFKTVNTPYDANWRSSILGNKFPASHIKLTPTYGVINGINYVEFSNITSFSGGSGGAGYGTPGSGGGVGLPVTWAGFTGKATERGNELNWQTASEQNTDYFQVEYSYDGNQFTTIADKIQAAGNSADLRSYSYLHADFATYTYYRIKQVDLDGKIDYSKKIALKRTAQPTFTVDVFPVPMNNDNLVNVSVKSIDKSNLTIQLTDVTGKVVRYNSITPTTDAIFETFDLSPLTPGVYFIEVKNGQGKETIKIAR